MILTSFTFKEGCPTTLGVRGGAGGEREARVRFKEQSGPVILRSGANRREEHVASFRSSMSPDHL